MESLTLTPVGVIHSEHVEPGDAIQPVCEREAPGYKIFPEYEEASTDRGLLAPPPDHGCVAKMPCGTSSRKGTT